MMNDIVYPSKKYLTLLEFIEKISTKEEGKKKV